MAILANQGHREPVSDSCCGAGDDTTSRHAGGVGVPACQALSLGCPRGKRRLVRSMCGICGGAGQLRHVRSRDAKGPGRQSSPCRGDRQPAGAAELIHVVLLLHAPPRRCGTAAGDSRAGGWGREREVCLCGGGWHQNNRFGCGRGRAGGGGRGGGGSTGHTAAAAPPGGLRGQ